MDPKTILVVDDTPANVTLICALLADTARTKIATGGQKALHIAASDPPPDLILLDVMMPDMDGYEVCRQLKANERTRLIPVIFLTASTDQEAEQIGLTLGAVDYVTKPISPPILLARVRTHLELKDASDKLQQQNALLEQRVAERTRELMLTNRSLSRFIPNDFLHALGRDNILDVQLGDHVEGTMSVLSLDIRAYTTLAETLSPREVFDFTNGFFGRMGPIVRAHNGFVAQFTGDGFMAVFPSNPADAIRAAIEMQQALGTYNQERRSKSRQPLKMGIGINTGSLMLGVVGDSVRTYTAQVSDTVNTTARLEGLTKYYGVSIVISEATYKGLEDPNEFQSRQLDRVLLKGKHVPTTIHEIFSADAAETRQRKSDTLERFKQGQHLYFERSFAEALKCFAEVLTILPDDLTTKLYLERTAKLLLEGAPADWLGVRIMETK